MKANLKILILEDNQNDADLLLRELKRSGINFISEIVQTREEFENALQNFSPDIILADYSLPSFDGLTAFNIKQNISPDIPFIIVSGVIGEENAVELIRNGVTDFAQKDKLFVLIPKINRALKEAKEKKEKRIADEELVFQNEEKEKLAAELIIANKKLALQNEESEEQFEAIFNDAPMGIAIIDSLTGNIFNVNPKFAKIAGRTIAEMVNIDWTGITHPDDIQLELNKMAQLLAGEINGFRMEKRYIHPDGSFVWINMTISKILYHNKSHPRHLCMIEDITERIKAQNEIFKEKNLSDSIINSLPGIFYLFNMEGKFLRWNKNFETESKYSAKEIREMHPLDFFDENEKELVSRKIKNVFISGKENVQANFLLKTKEKIPYYFTGIALSYEGSPCLLGVGIDFSELKKTQQALAENENHLRVILQATPECIKLVGINGELEEMNPAGLAMIEADSFEQIIGKSLLDVIDKPYRKAFSQLTQNVFKGKSGKLEFEITGLKGTHCTMETHAVPLKDAEGKILSLLGITRDITEHKKTEKEILRAIERYDMIAKATSDTIWDWDITSDKIFYNEGLVNMFGYEKTNIEDIPAWWKSKIHPDDLQIVLEAVAAAYKKQSYNLQLEYRFRCADESFKYIYDRAFVIYDEHKKPCRMIGAMQDVSQLKENEISLNELNNNLQKQAKELSISNEELEQFAYMVSHDLQEPLRMVTSFLTQLNRKYGDVIDDKGKKYIFFAVDGAKRMRKIILDLLEFSRVGRTEDIQKKLDLNEIIDEIKILFRKKIEEKSAIIQVGQLPVINAHKAPILQVFQNLISNAFKYSREDIPAQIHITAKELKNHWQFGVADNGIGISEEYFDKIFVIFQRLHNKDEYSGTGIGLAVTKKIIESQNGKIWVESEEGKGSIFYFTIKKTDK